MKSSFQRKLLVFLLLPFLATAGCSTGAAPTGAVTVSADDMKAGTIHIARTYLDSMEQMPLKPGN
jgi:hypothetical protein